MMGEAIVTAPATTKQRAPRWMWALMVFSLALNFLIFGVVIGGIIAVNRGGYWEAPTATLRAQHFMAGLSAQRRAEIRKIFLDHRTALEPYWGGVREARRRVGLLIERGGYTREELSAAIDDLNDKENRSRTATKPMVLAMLAKLEPQDRLLFLRIFLPYLNDLHGRPEPASREGGVLGQTVK